MRSEVRRIADEAWKIVADPRASRVEKLEGLKLLAACRGILIPELNERWLTVRQVCQLRQTKQALVEKVLQKREKKKRANRRAYLRRKIKQLEGQEPNAGD